MKQAITQDYIDTVLRLRPVRVPIDEVSHFIAQDKYVTAYTARGELLLRTTIKYLAALYGDQAVQLCRGHLVFSSRIASTYWTCAPRGGGVAVLVDGTELPVGRRYFYKRQNEAKRACRAQTRTSK